MPPIQTLTVYARTDHPGADPPQMSVPLTPEVLEVVQGSRVEADVYVTFTAARFTGIHMLDTPVASGAFLTAPRPGTPELGRITREDGLLRVSVEHGCGDRSDSLPVTRPAVLEALHQKPARPRPNSPAGWQALAAEPNGVTLVLGTDVYIVIPPAGEDWPGYDVMETHVDGAALHATGLTHGQAQAIAEGICRHYRASGVTERAGHAHLHVMLRETRVKTYRTQENP